MLRDRVTHTYPMSLLTSEARGENEDSHEWRFLKGMMRRNLPYRQEGAYELEDTALVAKREQELPLEVISSIGA